ncbi:hypothetical protein KI387_023807 [Taxus chinensis]|uniref:PLD phosphodiesterase domain-containing protein n=1 Tax=Taxus chinensis TaxID=29808 RepID=A0AA38G4I7_TAXCH|nr:hypothetical protein KI387_023807 [Taxus chinensis]
MKYVCVVVLLVTLQLAFADENENERSCRSWLVQSIPTDMPHLHRVPGVLSSGDVLRWIAGNSSTKLDIIAQYWELLAQPHNPKSGDYGYSAPDLERFGAPLGNALFKSLNNAADRNVSTRIVQHSGVSPDYDEESARLAAGRHNVKNTTLLLGEWWGSGIVHAKVWISDEKDIYIGSANNDWKSLTQVKELGIYIVNCSTIAEKVGIYFDNLWALTSLNSSLYTKTVWDNEWQVRRKVPCWSHFIHYRQRCKSPLPSRVETPGVLGYPPLEYPHMLHVHLDTPGRKNRTRDYSSYLSFSPPELSFYRYQTDEQGWIDTIKSAHFKGTVRISTMDWLGQSQYMKQTVYWPTLSSAISEVVLSKHATVKILVAYWAHFINNTEQYLQSLLYTNVICSSSSDNRCSGKVDIKYYKVPGFNATGPASVKGNVYPGYTRVNHGKYAMSDVRAHIGTSNLVWDYFYTTAGISFGSYDPSIVAQLTHIFDADWDSPYAIPLQPPLNTI